MLIRTNHRAGIALACVIILVVVTLAVMGTIFYIFWRAIQMLPITQPPIQEIQSNSVTMFPGSTVTAVIIDPPMTFSIGTNMVIQRSFDLLTWQDIATNDPTVATNILTQPTVFYRAKYQ